MSRIYLISNGTKPARLVRANTLTGAIRAHWEESFTARAATTEEVWHAMKEGAQILDAVAVDGESP